LNCASKIYDDYVQKLSTDVNRNTSWSGSGRNKLRKKIKTNFEAEQYVRLFIIDLTEVPLQKLEVGQLQ
jgi:hypothetical protein